MAQMVGGAADMAHAVKADAEVGVHGAIIGCQFHRTVQHRERGGNIVNVDQAAAHVAIGFRHIRVQLHRPLEGFDGAAMVVGLPGGVAEQQMAKCFPARHGPGNDFVGAAGRGFQIVLGQRHPPGFEQRGEVARFAGQGAIEIVFGEFGFAEPDQL